MIVNKSVTIKDVFNYTPHGVADNKSAFGQVMAWRHKAPSHYLIQCWSRSMQHSVPRTHGVRSGEWWCASVIRAIKRSFPLRRHARILLWSWIFFVASTSASSNSWNMIQFIDNSASMAHYMVHAWDSFHPSLFTRNSKSIKISNIETWKRMPQRAFPVYHEVFFLKN